MKSTIFWDITPYFLLALNGLHGVISQKMVLLVLRSWDISVGIATGYGLDG
jgi:hypothetical protein